MAGVALNEQKASKLTDHELEKHVAFLPKQLKVLILNRPACLTECTTASYLKEWCFSACDKWQTNRIEYDATRLQYIHDLRDDKKISHSKYSSNLKASGKDAMQRAMMYGAPEKIHEWLLVGGCKGHSNAKILQLFGFTILVQKRTGAIGAFESLTNKKRR